MNINKTQFEILVYIEREGGRKLSQREIAEKTGLSLGTVNKTLAELASLGLVGPISGRKPSSRGPGWRHWNLSRQTGGGVGGGLRFPHGPHHFEHPKPLVRVHGKRIVETLLDAVSAAGIPEIVLVRGYLGEQFEVLKHRYPHIQFLENPPFNEGQQHFLRLGRPRPASKAPTYAKRICC